MRLIDCNKKHQNNKPMALPNIMKKQQEKKKHGRLTPLN